MEITFKNERVSGKRGNLGVLAPCLWKSTSVLQPRSQAMLFMGCQSNVGIENMAMKGARRSCSFGSKGVLHPCFLKCFKLIENRGKHSVNMGFLCPCSSWKNFRVLFSLLYKTTTILIHPAQREKIFNNWNNQITRTQKTYCYNKILATTKKTNN